MERYEVTKVTIPPDEFMNFVVDQLQAQGYSTPDDMSTEIVNIDFDRKYTIGVERGEIVSVNVELHSKNMVAN